MGDKGISDAIHGFHMGDYGRVVESFNGTGTWEDVDVSFLKYEFEVLKCPNCDV